MAPYLRLFWLEVIIVVLTIILTVRADDAASGSISTPTNIDSSAASDDFSGPNLKVGVIGIAHSIRAA